jgi:hypothetical protein
VCENHRKYLSCLFEFQAFLFSLSQSQEDEAMRFRCLAASENVANLRPEDAIQGDNRVQTIFLFQVVAAVGEVKRDR